MVKQQSTRLAFDKVTAAIGTVTIDITWRLADGSLLLLEWLPWSTPTGDLSIPVLSLLVGSFAAPTITQVTTWLIIILAFLVFVEYVYPDRTRVPTEDIGFRWLFAAFALMLTVVIDVFSNNHGNWPLLVGIVIGAIVAFVGYLQWVSVPDAEWDALEPTERALQPAQFITDEDISAEIEADLARSGVIGLLGTVLWLTALGFLLVLPCFIAAALALALLDTYPLPDILILIWAGYTLADRTSFVDVPDLRRDRIDIEKRLFREIRHGLKSIKGLALTVCVLCGIFAAAQLFWLGFSVALMLYNDGIVYNVVPLLAWNLVGVAVLSLIVGVYTLWFWAREFRRLDPFLSCYEGTAPAASPNTRVVGWTVPTLSVSVFGLAVIVGAESLSILFAVATLWPGVAVALGGMAWLTSQRHHQSVSHEDTVIMGALLVQTISVELFGQRSAVRDLLVGGELTIPFPMEILPIGVILIGLTYFDDISRYADRYQDVRRFALPGYLLLLGLSIGMSSLLSAGWVRLAIFGTVGVCVLGAIGLALTRYFRV